MLSAILLCVSCAARADDADVFVCDDGKGFTVIFESAGTALIMIDGGALRLQDRRSASGYWFASRYGEFRGKGNTATFRMIGRAPTICHKVGG